MKLMIEKDGIRSQVVKALRQAIITGELTPGQRLIEADLCGTLGISRPSLREALRHLETERLVHFIPNRGCFVADLGWEEARQIYDARTLLEPELAARAAVNRSEDQLAEIAAAVADFEAAVAGQDKLGQIMSSKAFYEALFDAAGNVILGDVLNGLNARISVLRGRSMSQPDRSGHSLRELDAIHLAIRDRDPERARQAAGHHLEQAAAAALSVMKRTPETA